MALKDIYKKIAERAIKASNDTRKQQEKSAFHSYHAFESIGCALVEYSGGNASRGVSHQEKLNRFSTTAKNHCSATEANKIAKLAVTLGNMRNDLLYPVWDPAKSDYVDPDTFISPSQAQDLKKNVASVIVAVKKVIL